MGALQRIAKTIGKTDWNFSVDPCTSGESSWVNPNQIKGAENAVTCNCSFANNTVCHVVSMYVCLISHSFFFISSYCYIYLLHYVDLWMVNGNVNFLSDFFVLLFCPDTPFERIEFVLKLFSLSFTRIK